MMKYSIDDLVYLMQRLREPETGCPWDLKQNYQSIVPSTLEEAYEVADAIERADYHHLKEELGDLLFQVIFYCQLGREEQRFDFSEVVSGLVEKLVRRHPHVFPAGALHDRIDAASTEDETLIKRRWEQLKQQERSDKGESRTLADVPLNLPALSRAQKLQKRAANVGFDWPDIDGALAKVAEELDEVRQAQAAGSDEALAEELGDLLFAVVNVSRHAKRDAEQLLRLASQKFERRFNLVEERLQARGLTLDEADLEILDSLWREVKAAE